MSQPHPGSVPGTAPVEFGQHAAPEVGDSRLDLGAEFGEGRSVLKVANKSHLSKCTNDRPNKIVHNFKLLVSSYILYIFVWISQASSLYFSYAIFSRLLVSLDMFDLCKCVTTTTLVFCQKV